MEQPISDIRNIHPRIWSLTFLFTLFPHHSSHTRSLSVLHLCYGIMFRITPSTTRSILTRSLSTSAPSRLRPRETLSTSASQPVFKKDLPPQPRPPTRPLPSSPRSAPTPSGADRGKGGKEEVKGGKPGSIYASYKALPYNTKLVFWTCGAGKSFLPPLATSI